MFKKIVSRLDQFMENEITEIIPLMIGEKVF